MTKFYLPIPTPKFIESIVVYFLLRYRKKHFGYAFRKIYLTKGKYAMVSQQDFERINQYKWHATNNQGLTCYAIRTIHINGGGRKRLMMHREIMNPPAGLFVDHGDGNGLNNTRDNLSIVTAAENCYNRRKMIRQGTSKYKGVSLDKRLNKYRAEITYKGIKIFLGYFDNEIDAAKAYDEAAKELFGEYAKLNFN